jgi:acyl-coenzyme A thioesterase 13
MHKVSDRVGRGLRGGPDEDAAKSMSNVQQGGAYSLKEMFGMADQDAAPPAGFEPLFRSSPFSEAVGPFFYRKEPSGSFVVGVRVLPKHANARGGAHGGFLMTLVDIALGYRAAFSEQPPAALITASLCADFVGAAKIGDWVEAHVDVHKVGSRLAFANAFLMVNGERIVRANAVFSRTAGALPESARAPSDRSGSEGSGSA